MSTQDLLLEIGTEEIPSGYFGHILDVLSCREGSPVRRLFEAQNIIFYKSFCYTTPRRIILHVKDIPLTQDLVINGPPHRVAYEKDGSPTKALKAFLEKNNAAPGDVTVDSTEKEPRLIMKKNDVHNIQILSGMLPKIIALLDFPKAMRWNESGFLFARPIRWLFALFGDKVIDFETAALRSSRISYGHRFSSHKKLKAKDIGSYFRGLSRNYVIWDNEARKEKILSFLEKRRWHENRQLLDEVSNLVEYPVFIEGRFSDKYLKIPREVLLAGMSKYQRLFCLKDRKGNMTNRFIGVLDGNCSSKRGVIRNFENVLDARLRDALFFYEADTKKPLRQWAEGLKSVVFHKRLGTLADKAERLKKIAHFLLKETGITDCDKGELLRTASLCKADLLTHMVGEFPSLQGIIGRYYALDSGEPADVADAVAEHYLPRFTGDKIPVSSIGTVLSLADKLDNIICYFKIGKFPKGNWDLYALRRQAIGIISILLKKKLFLPLSGAFDFIYPICPGDLEGRKLKKLFLDFFTDRAVYLAKTKFGYSHDLIEAVTAKTTDDIYNSFLKLESLDCIIDKPYFEKSRSIVERTHNIIKASGESFKNVVPSLLLEPEEKSLYAAFKELKPVFEKHCRDREYKEATRAFGESLAEKVHDFFDKVMVNVDKKTLRVNRLCMLSGINRLYTDNIADLSKIVVENKSAKG